MRPSNGARTASAAPSKGEIGGGGGNDWSSARSAGPAVELA